MSPGPTPPDPRAAPPRDRALCDRLGVEPVTDPSNRSPFRGATGSATSCCRSLADIAERDVVPILARTADLLRDDDTFLDELAAAIDPTDAKASPPHHRARPAGVAPMAHRGRGTRPTGRHRAGARRRSRRGGGVRDLGRPRGSNADGRPALPRPGHRPVESGTRHVLAPPLSQDVQLHLHGAPADAPKLRGKWALGITPRHFTWILKDKLAICERPGGYGDNHRRVRRQEEIIWIRENGFNYAISIIQAPAQPAQLRRAQPAVPAPPVPCRRSRQLVAVVLPRDRRPDEARQQADRARRGARRPASSASWAATSAGPVWSTTRPRRSRSPSG
jgi:hypothetical protein